MMHQLAKHELNIPRKSQQAFQGPAVATAAQSQLLKLPHAEHIRQW